MSFFSWDTVSWIVLQGWKPLIEILVIAYVVYILLRFVRGTRAVQLLIGMFLVVFLFFVSQKLELYAINFLLTKIFAFSMLGILIIFQPELRRMLSKLGQNRVFGSMLEEVRLAEITNAIAFLAKKRIGALVVIERHVGLRNYVESGIVLDSHISAELLMTIFMPTTALHDGAVIVQGERIASAGSLLPLSTNTDIAKTVGTRHRAAIGITEETDAIAIVVSEKNGIISLVLGGDITRDLDSDTLKKVLSKQILKGDDK